MGEEKEVITKGLMGSTQDNALAELADLAFADDSDLNHVMLIVQAIDLQSKGNLAEAAKNYQQAVQGGMQKTALFFNLGLLWKELGRPEQAVELLNRSAQDNKYGLGTQFALGETYQGANRLDSALRHFFDLVKQVDLRMVPSYQAQQLSQHYGNLMNTYLAERDIKKINMFISSVKNFFSHPAWERKAFEARQIMDGVKDNGMMSLAEYLETPETEVVITAMALTNQYINRNMLMTASEECLRAIQRVPAYLPLHVRLADIILKQDRIDEAVAKYMSIARVYEMRGAPEQAIEVYQKVLRTAPLDVTILSALIDIYTARHDTEKALEHYLALAHSYYTFAQVDRALEKYNEALRLANNSSNSAAWKVEILQKVGDIYMQRFDWARATTAYEEINRVKAGDVEVQRRLIDLYYKQSKTHQAVTLLDQLLSLYQRQNPLKSVDVLKDLATSRPEDMALRQRLAVAYVQNGLTREAIGEYDALGEMQLEQGLRDQAIQTIQAIIHLGPDDAEGYRRLLNQISWGAL
jgi:tetratricopeptide (TPR) repeat protein